MSFTCSTCGTDYADDAMRSRKGTQCKPCVNAKARARYNDHYREKQIAHSAAWAAAHREEAREANRKWREARNDGQPMQRVPNRRCEGDLLECRTCHQMKPFSAFSDDRDASYGKRIACKACHTARERARYHEKHPEARSYLKTKA